VNKKKIRITQDLCEFMRDFRGILGKDKEAHVIPASSFFLRVALPTANPNFLMMKHLFWEEALEMMFVDVLVWMDSS